MLLIPKINIYDTYQITIFEPQAVDALCQAYHPYSLNVSITLYCSSGNASPTNESTKEPTLQPTLATNAPMPTLHPTLSPTYSSIDCSNGNTDNK